MVNIGRNEVSRFQYSSSAGATAEAIYNVGTASNLTRRVYITDLKVSCGGTARTLKIYSDNYDTVQPIEIDLPANSTQDFKWELPYEMVVVGSTGENRSIVASASGAGIKYNICGYIDK